MYGSGPVIPAVSGTLGYLKLLEDDMGQLGLVGQSSGCVLSWLMLRFDNEANAHERSVGFPEFVPG
jgi:hypothetical protein